MHPFRDPDLSEKVASLRRPETFPDQPDSVETIETHFAWVFLAGRFVYKLKKPVRFPDFDLTTLQGRRAICELELALNRRLAPDTYIGVVPLGRRGPRLMLEYDDNPADWLVKMHRLPAEATLEKLSPSMEPGDPRLELLIDVLCDFYRRTARAPWDCDTYIDSLDRQAGHYAEELMIPELTDDHETVQRIAEHHYAFTDAERSLLAGRLAAGRVCDAHGDLRPEHVFLTDSPQIIDCLEFSTELRQLDSAEEISFLALECDRLDRPDLGQRLTELYIARCNDNVPSTLLHYYRSRRALVRAFLCAWHLEDGLAESAARQWLTKSRWYIAQAACSIDAAFQESPISLR